MSHLTAFATAPVARLLPRRAAASLSARCTRGIRALSASLILGALLPGVVRAQEAILGGDLQGLLAYARAQSPELESMRREAEAAGQRVGSAGALLDPVLRVELMNINNYGNDAPPSLLPSRVGETKYTLMQALPLWGKRELRRDAAVADAAQAVARSEVTWSELAARVKTSYAEYYRAIGNERLTTEVLQLLARLEQIAQARYAGGLVPQQDAIRAQLEQTALRLELVGLENEKRQSKARLNGLLARDANAPLADPQALRPWPTVTTFDAPTLAERARARNPQLQAELARLAGAQKIRDLTLRNRYPDLVVGVVPTQVGSRITQWGLMFEINIPLQQDSRRAQEREAEATVGAARARSEALSNQLLAELAGTLSAFDAAVRAESLIRSQLLPQSELSLQSSLAAYENGKVDFATLLEAQRQIRKGRQELLKSRVEAQLRLADIERILGEQL